MLEIAIVFTLLIALFVIVQKSLLKKHIEETASYILKRSVLTANEKAYYTALIEALNGKAIVQVKTQISQVISPQASKNKKEWVKAYSRISRSSFDFVICELETFHPICVIEFDNGKELDKAKVERERLLLNVCKSANLPLLGGSIKHTYQVNKLRQLLSPYIKNLIADNQVRFCKKCHSPMVVKTASSGELQGRKFFICSRAPSCNYLENINEGIEV
jgi:hypothetical protein